MRGKLGALLLKVILLACISVGAAHAISYTYDELGRLKAVTDDAGNSAEYLYDPVGNIVQIKQVPSGTLSITEFTPNSGPIGASVTIFGGGFSPTAASNVVKFNGTAATVTSAAVNKLVVTVPAGATTGKITVTVGTTTATSTDDFVITANTGAPTITGFTPTCAAPGATVTLTGTNFDPAPNATKVELNNSVAQATVSSATSITMTVPLTSIGSGKIRVVTQAGIATSTASLLVPPSGLTCADILSSVTVVTGGANQTLTLGTANKYGAILFDGNQNDYLTLQLSNLITNPANVSISYTVYKPDNTQLVSGSISSTSLSIHLPALPTTGTYTILFNPGSATASFSAQLTANSLSVDGAAISGSITAPWQSLRYSFTANAGQNLGLGLSALTLTPSSASYASVTVYKPDGVYLNATTCYVSYSGCELNLSNLPVTGTYSVVVIPASGATGSFTLTLSSDITGALTAGTPLSLSLSRIGQNGRLTFSGTAGSNVGIEVAGLSTVPAGKPIALTVYKPDGTTLSSTTASSPGGGFLNLSNLPVTGTYTVLIDPYYGATATMQVKLGATDLVLSGATLGALTANQDGSYNIPVTFTVTNQGNVTAKAVWFDMAYLSADATLDNADQNLSGYNYRNTDVAPGASYTVTVTHRTLSTTAPGNYTLFIKADGHGTQVGGANTNTGYLAEGNEVNNVQALTLTLPTKADLTVSSVTIGGIVKNANSSYSIPVTFTVTNQGSIAAKSYWFDLAYLSADATLDNADLNLSGYNYRNTDVAPGASYTVTVTYTTSTTTTAGAYRLFIKADGHGAQVGGTNTDSGNVTESNETNNAASVAITLP